MDISVDDLRAAGLDAQFEAIEAAVERFESGGTPNVAVVTDPFAGREVLLDYAESRLPVGAERTRFSGAVPRDEVPDLDDGSVFVFDDCQYLYTRQIGGFEPLDAFLDRIALSDSLVVTSWNRYAWDYLRSVRDIGAAFSRQIVVPPLDAAQVTELLTTHYGPDLPAFVQTGAAGRVKTLGFEDRGIPLPGERRLDVPVPELNLEYLASRSNTAADDTEAVVFQKLTALSKGNPGVARVLWERSVRDGEIAPAYVREVEGTVDADDETAFLLSLVLSNEAIGRTTLEEVVSDGAVDRALQSLVEQNLVTVEGDRATLVPERFHAAVDHLRGRRLLW